MKSVIGAIKNFFKYILIDFWADREATKGQKDNQAVITADMARIKPLGGKEIKERSIRPLGWIIIIFNVFWVYRLLKGLYEIGLSGQSDGMIGLTAILFIITWLIVSAAVNIILYVIYRVTNKRNKRSCPACGRAVAVGLTVCPGCNFDFAKAAGQGIN